MIRYRMPAEWEPHRATWLAWPHRRSDWPGRFAPIPWVYAEIVRTLSRFEPVEVITRDSEQQAKARKILKASHAEMGRVHLSICETDRSWLRDSGPIYTFDEQNEKIALDWHFNAWAKYPDWTNDDLIPAFASNRGGVQTVRPMHNDWRIVLEGGSIDVNGQGLLLTTEECLLSKLQERNPPMNRADYEAAFEKYLGIQKVIWLNKGIVGDDTHGHIDDLARFVNPTTIVAVEESNEADENYSILQENLERLRAVQGIEIVSLPMPRPIIFQKQRLPASYANFYLANGVVIVPTFNDPADRVALGILADLFPDREVVGISSIDLIWGLGTLHCMTQQEPQ